MAHSPQLFYGNFMLRLTLAFLLFGFAAHAEEPWMRLPPTPALPHADRAATTPVNGIQLWYAVFGSGHGSPVLLLHGGLGQ